MPLNPLVQPLLLADSSPVPKRPAAHASNAASAASAATAATAAAAAGAVAVGGPAAAAAAATAAAAAERTSDGAVLGSVVVGCHNAATALNGGHEQTQKQPPGVPDLSSRRRKSGGPCETGGDGVRSGGHTAAVAGRAAESASEADEAESRTSTRKEEQRGTKAGSRKASGRKPVDRACDWGGDGDSDGDGDCAGLSRPLLLPHTTGEAAAAAAASGAGNAAGGDAVARASRLLERKRSLVREAALQSRMAWPMMVTNLLQNVMPMTSLAFVGRLGELPLASASIATCFCNVMGHILLQGLASGLETLCGQAYGAGALPLLGLYLQRALLCMGAAALPMALAWWHAAPLLLLLGQSSHIAVLAGTYARLLLPCLAANVGMQCLERFLQSQGVTLPMAMCAMVAAMLHGPLTWLLVFHLGFGFVGAPMALSLSFCLNLLLLVAYVTLSGVARGSWTGFSWDAFCGWGEFLALAVPSTVMLCLEYWSFDMVTLMAGWLPNPDVQVSGLSIILNSSVLAFVIPYGFGVAVSTRVANELGAGAPQKALTAGRVAVMCGVAEAALVALLLYLARGSWGRLFTSAPAVVAYVTDLVPVVLVSIVSDSVNAVLSGVVRGCGYQHAAVLANLAAYYAIGLPLAALLAFRFGLGGKGLWIGLTVGTLAQLCSVLTIVLRTSFDDASRKARERIEETLLALEEDDVDEVTSWEDEEERAYGAATAGQGQGQGQARTGDASQDSDGVTIVC